MTDQSVNIDPDPDINPEPDTDMERVVNPRVKKLQLQQQHSESKWRHRQEIKRNQRINQRISY